jgi:sporulation-control protein spo0M
MARNMLPKNEFEKIKKAMEIIPQKKDESQNMYFKRISENIENPRSRTTLQLVCRAIKNSDDDIDQAYDLYAEYSRSKCHEKKRKEPEQLKMDIPMPDDSPAVEENGTINIRVSVELGENAKKVIDGLLTLMGVKLQ